MKNSKVLKAGLVVSGLLATGIGGAILFTPETFHAINGIYLGTSSSLLSEVRAHGGLLMASGILIMLGAFADRLTFTSAVLSALLYLSYGMSRFLSMVVDGMPAEGLVQAAVLELVIGLVCVVAFARSRRAPCTGCEANS